MIAPPAPSPSEWRQDELVPRGVDRFNPRQTEIPYQVGGAKRREKSAARRIHVEWNVRSAPLLEIVQGLGDGLDGLVLAAGGHPERRDHHNGIFVATSERLFR